MSRRIDRSNLIRIVDGLCAGSGDLCADFMREAGRIGPWIPAVRAGLSHEIRCARRADQLSKALAALITPAAVLFYVFGVPALIVVNAIWMWPLIHAWMLHAGFVMGIAEAWLLARGARRIRQRLTDDRIAISARRIRRLARLAADAPTNDSIPVLLDILLSQERQSIAMAGRSLVLRLRKMDRAERDRVFEQNRKAIDAILSGRRSESLHGLLGTLISQIEQDRRAEHLEAVRMIADGIAVTTNGLRTWQAAKSSLPILEEEARVRQTAARLVRPVESPEPALLRPAGATGESSAELLLRPSSTEL